MANAMRELSQIVCHKYHSEDDYQSAVSNYRIKNLKASYAKLRQDNLAIPQHLQKLPASLCTLDQLHEVLHLE